VSYQIACQQYDDKATAELVKAWLSYVTSSDGQQTSADDAGSAPLSDAISQKVKTAVDTIKAS
jgi:phosphate transport system substrate-binding protein